MPCCGDKRGRVRRQTTVGTSTTTGNGSTPRRVSSKKELQFEYIGQTGLTVRGTITGKRYRFTRPGALVSVDGRDGPSMFAVPNLRRVKN